MRHHCYHIHLYTVSHRVSQSRISGKHQISVSHACIINFSFNVHSFNIYSLCANIFQVVLLTTSIVCLIVTTAVVATGWAVTCKTFKEVQDDNNTPYRSFSCTGYQYQNAPPHGGEIIATAVSFLLLQQSNCIRCMQQCYQLL